ncbi:MAG: hypothetical protein JWQ70_280, partial [Aeromicrobium sp.]|nr:hypothetical protein [Aeromicrobium sp.]
MSRAASFQRSANTLSTLGGRVLSFVVAVSYEIVSNGVHEPRDGVPTSIQCSTAERGGRHVSVTIKPLEDRLVIQAIEAE